MYALYLSAYHERKFWFSNRQVRRKNFEHMNICYRILKMCFPGSQNIKMHGNMTSVFLCCGYKPLGTKWYRSYFESWYQPERYNRLYFKVIESKQWGCFSSYSWFIRDFLKKIFNWKIIALQNFVVFCHTSTWISHRYTHVPSLLNLSPFSLPIPPFSLSQSPCF